MSEVIFKDEDQFHISEVAPFPTSSPPKYRIRSVPPDSVLSVDCFSRPLPPPPPGLYWERQIDNSWLLREYENVSGFDETSIEYTFPYHSVIEHVVLPGDTFQVILLIVKFIQAVLKQSTGKLFFSGYLSSLSCVSN